MKTVHALALVYDNGDVYVDSSIKDQTVLTGIIEPNRPATVKRVKIVEDKKRSLSANALLHKWLAIVSEFTGENTLKTKNRFKKDFAWPIVQTNQPEWAGKIEFVLKRIGYYNFSESQQLNVWQMLELTSQMEVADLRRAMEHYKQWAIDTLDITLTNEKT